MVLITSLILGSGITLWRRVLTFSVGRLITSGRDSIPFSEKRGSDEDQVGTYSKEIETKLYLITRECWTYVLLEEFHNLFVEVGQS